MVVKDGEKVDVHELVRDSVGVEEKVKEGDRERERLGAEQEGEGDREWLGVQETVALGL